MPNDFRDLSLASPANADIVHLTTTLQYPIFLSRIHLSSNNLIYNLLTENVIVLIQQVQMSK
jgi:hypothetical protein